MDGSASSFGFNLSEPRTINNTDMDANKLKNCCEPLLEYASRIFKAGEVKPEDLKLIREQVVMACTNLAKDYSLENQKTAFTELEENAMREFFSLPLDDAILPEIRNCKSGDEIICTCLNVIARSMGDYDFGDATQVKVIIQPVLHEIQQFINVKK